MNTGLRIVTYVCRQVTIEVTLDLTLSFVLSHIVLANVSNFFNF